MISMGMKEAKEHFTELLAKVRAGEEVMIKTRGKRTVRMIPYTNKKNERQLGLLQGRIRVADDFDAPLPKAVLGRFYK